jgi:hypothetical protein
MNLILIEVSDKDNVRGEDPAANDIVVEKEIDEKSTVRI